MIAKPIKKSRIEVNSIPKNAGTDSYPSSTLKTVIVDISKYNEDDGFDEFKSHTSFKVITEINPMLCTDELFLITDSRKTADAASLQGIGFAGYLSDEKISNERVINEFPDSLYLITSLSELTDEALLRMYQRAKKIPWKIVETDRAIVREITTGDIDSLYGIYSDPETSRYIESLYENKEDEITFTENYINNQYRYFEYGLWAVTDRQGGKLIGRAGIFNREGYENPELGFVFLRSMWGKGIAYEVCSAIINYSKEEFGFDTFNAFTKPENTRGKHLLERLGFEYKCMQPLGDEEFCMYTIYSPL